jgi:hypothetical protein
VLKTVQRDAAPLFEMLRTKYAKSLERDSIFESVCFWFSVVDLICLAFDF